jgi:hypothetical protein
MNMFREDAYQQLAFMARARVNAGDARQAKDSKAFGAAVADFAIALQEFTSSMTLAEVLR